MPLTNVQENDIKEILIAIYGTSFKYCTPTENTVHLLETMLSEVSKCSNDVNTLLISLPVARIGKGWLVRVAKSLSKQLKESRIVFVGCPVTGFSRYKSPLYLSCI